MTKKYVKCINAEGTCLKNGGIYEVVNYEGEYTTVLINEHGLSVELEYYHSRFEEYIVTTKKLVNVFIPTANEEEFNAAKELLVGMGYSLGKYSEYEDTTKGILGVVGGRDGIQTTMYTDLHIESGYKVLSLKKHTIYSLEEVTTYEVDGKTLTKSEVESKIAELNKLIGE